jgi:hypothetical protein
MRGEVGTGAPVNLSRESAWMTAEVKTDFGMR